MKILSVRCILVSAPYASDQDSERINHLATGYRSAAVIKIEADNGSYGLGEPYAGSYAPLVVRQIVDQCAELFIGFSPLDIHSCIERLQHAIRYWGRTGVTQGVAGALEMALYDLKGKILGQPVYELLGGLRHDALPVYASGGNDKPETELRREMEEYIATGYSAVKIRVNNLSTEQMLAKVRICHEMLHGRAGLAVDAVQSNVHCPWSLKQAKLNAKLFEPFDLLWLEEPLGPERIEDLSELRRSTRIPIAGGETASTIDEAQRYFTAKALDIFQPDAAVLGLHNFVRAGILAHAFGVDLAVHAWCGAVGHMANYHAAFATESCKFLEQSSVYNPLRDLLLVEPLELNNGCFSLKPLPGLGVQLPDDLERQFPYRDGTHYRFVTK